MNANELRLAAEYHRGYTDGKHARDANDKQATKDVLQEFGDEVVRSYLLDNAAHDRILEKYAKRLRVR